jgi:hypothetical protein
MANEIKLASSLQIKNGVFQYNHATSLAITQVNIGGGNPGLVQFSTTQEQITFGELSTPGLVLVQNMDSTNNIQLGNYVSSVFYPIVRLNPGESYVFRLHESVVLYGKASAGTPKGLIHVFEN